MPTTPSAAERRRRQQIQSVQRAAVTLTIDKGFDGFTMDELAERVGVSRKTLFNWVGDKASAVLGPDDSDQLLDRADVLLGMAPAPFDALIQAVFALGGTTPTDTSVLELHTDLRRAVAAEPRLAQETRRRTREQVDVLAGMVSEREGWGPQDPRPRILVRVFGELLDEAIERLLISHAAGQPAAFVEEFRAVVDAFRAITAPEAGLHH